MTARGGTAEVDDRQGREPKRRLSIAECRAWLSSHDEGRLSYLTGRGPRSVVVLCEVAENAIVMRLPDFHDAAHYAPGADVRLDVEGVGTVCRDAVRVTGQAVAADLRQLGFVGAAGIDLDEGSSRVKTSVVCLPINNVEGYEIVLTSQPTQSES